MDTTPGAVAAAPSMCAPELRDVWTKIIPFLREPGVLRSCNQYLAGCWDHLIYLEGELSCPYVLLQPKENSPLITDWYCVPVSLGRLHRIDHTCHLQLMGPLLRVDVSLLRTGRRHPWLREITVSGLENLFTIQEHFLSESVALKKVTFEDLPELSNVEREFLSNCPNLELAKFSRLPKLTTVGQFWLAECPVLTEATFSDLPQLTRVDDEWLQRCSSLLVFAPVLPKLRHIGVVAFCTSLREVDLSGLPEITQLGNPSLCDCSTLESISVGPGLDQLETIALFVLSDCKNLKTAKFTQLPKLRAASQHWLSGCEALESAEFIDLPLLQSIGKHWLQDCPSLEACIFINVPSLNDVETQCLNFKNATPAHRGKFIQVGDGCHEDLKKVLEKRSKEDQVDE